jgi:hypothetical protein
VDAFAALIGGGGVILPLSAIRVNRIEFLQGTRFLVDNYTPPARRFLHTEAMRSLDAENAGGKSEISEAYSIDHLSRLFGSFQTILEMEVRYWARYKMVDYILKLPSGSRLGVSVTRAMTRSDLLYTRDDAVRLLNKKLKGLIVSRNAVVRDHSFFHSVLHIWAPSQHVADLIQDVIRCKDVDLEELELVGSMDIWITVCGHSEIYTNRWADCTSSVVNDDRLVRLDSLDNSSVHRRREFFSVAVTSSLLGLNISFKFRVSMILPGFPGFLVQVVVLVGFLCFCMCRF